MSKYTRVEDYININDNNILWYNINGFNGYELSNTNVLRSMKHFRKYPYGMLIHCKTGSENDPVFELTDSNNTRVSMKLSELISIINANKQLPGYPRHTNVTTMSSRNPAFAVHKPIQEASKVPNITAMNFIKIVK